MSAPEVTDRLVEAIRSGKYDAIVCNYANGDMVGHTGVIAAAVKACETVDRCVGRIEAFIRERGGVMLITADHGNAEQMVDPETGEPHTAHTLNPVPFILVADAYKGQSLRSGGALNDIAPTIMTLMGLPIPAEMEGESLLDGSPTCASS
jgi:2,3-bisphosphoglycerate-independent phosphoglycerate mutase